MMRGRAAVYATSPATTRSRTTRGCSGRTRWRPCKWTSSSTASPAPAGSLPAPTRLRVLDDGHDPGGDLVKQRNGYSLEQLVERSIDGGDSPGCTPRRTTGTARWRTRRQRGHRPGRRRVEEQQPSPIARSVVLAPAIGWGSVPDGQAPAHEEIDARHPSLIPQRSPASPRIGWLALVQQHQAPSHRAWEQMALTICGAAGSRARTRSPTTNESPRPRRVLRTDGFDNVADIMVGSFYVPNSTRAMPSRS